MDFGRCNLVKLVTSFEIGFEFHLQVTIYVDILVISPNVILYETGKNDIDPPPNRELFGFWLSKDIILKQLAHYLEPGVVFFSSHLWFLLMPLLYQDPDHLFWCNIGLGRWANWNALHLLIFYQSSLSLWGIHYSWEDVLSFQELARDLQIKIHLFFLLMILWWAGTKGWIKKRELCIIISSLPHKSNQLAAKALHKGLNV